VLLVVLLGLLLSAAPAAAHPLGNFTTNTSAVVLPADPVTEVVYVLDLAEVPTQQTRPAIDAAGAAQDWAAQECSTIAAAQQLVVADTTRALTAVAATVTFPDGEAGLQTLRLTCVLESPTGDLPDPVEVVYEDGYVSGRTGWREVIATGDDSTVLEADVPAVSATDQLRRYPEATVSRTTTATLRVDPDEGAPAPAALREDAVVPIEPVGGIEGLVQRYTDLVSRQRLTPGFVVLAALLSILLGTAHAVAPGHGKTVIAAYLLGEGGQARAAMALGGTVAVTHTIGVLLLGVAVQTSTVLAPESLYPILGAAGGVLFTLVGLLLLRRALARRGHDHHHDHHHGHDHDHDHGHGHGHRAHHDHDRDHGTAPADTPVAVLDPPHVDPVAAAPADRMPGWRMLVLPGLAGGMVPSPSALVVLLGGIALGRTWFGILLVGFYGVGMALALVGAGYLLHRLRFRVMDRLEGPTWARVSAVLPVATSSLIVVGGLVIVARSLLSA
jgi:ABC-type nickel/cobalt efflux system permease component RcnA